MCMDAQTQNFKHRELRKGDKIKSFKKIKALIKSLLCGNFPNTNDRVP